MQITISGRIVEKSAPRPSAVDFIQMAAHTGYDGVGLRPWQVGPDTTAEELAAVREALAATGLSIASLTMTHDAVAATVPLARELGVRVLQVSGEPAQLADAAKLLDDDMRLGPQMHTRGEFETVALAAQTLKDIGDPRVGVVVEPANLAMAGEEWSDALLAPIAGDIIGCNLQSIEPGGGDAHVKLRDGTEVPFQRVPARENSQADFPTFFGILRSAGYDGYVNVIEPQSPDYSIQDLARATADSLRTILHS